MMSIYHTCKETKEILSVCFSIFFGKIIMERRRRKNHKFTTHDSEEVSSVEWELINMTEQEEDLIYRMYRLVGDRWDLIAGRIPGRQPEEIERFWIMKNSQGFAEKRRERPRQNKKSVWRSFVRRRLPSDS